MTTIEILRGARELIARPGGWTQGSAARDDEGLPVGWDHDLWSSAMEALEDVVRMSVSEWNDMRSRTQAEVVAAFDRAIATLEAKS